MIEPRYIVLEEHTLGYVLDAVLPRSLWVLAGKVIGGRGHDPMNGPVAIGPLDKQRPATLADFHAFRVSPKGHNLSGEISMTETTTHDIGSGWTATWTRGDPGGAETLTIFNERKGGYIELDAPSVENLRAILRRTGK